jgi:hypothetical protein
VQELRQSSRASNRLLLNLPNRLRSFTTDGVKIRRSLGVGDSICTYA